MARFLLLALVAAPLFAYPQSNTFPTSGNVGIGTASPTRKLEVKGVTLSDAYAFPFAQYDFSARPRTQLGSMSIRLFDDYITYRPGGTPPEGNNYGTLLAIYGRSSHWQTDIYFGVTTKRMYFRTSAYSAHTSETGVVGGFHHWRTILDSKSNVASSGLLQITGTGNHYIQDGNLGIGTVNPQAKLSVNGNILAKEIKVKTDIAVPDYVFEETYELLSLWELDSYIKQHKHLPEVPSAAEIREEGLDLAGMNLLLLKKVEELTLYVIGIKKELDQKNTELEDLKNEIANWKPLK